MKLLGFSKKEFVVVFGTVLVVIFATYTNLLVSFRRSRDNTRRNDIRAIQNALVAYQIDNANFPASKDGKIVACDGGVDELGVPQRRPCEWQEDPFRDIFYPDYPPYIKSLPSDPYHDRGARYLYLSNGRHFQIFASLEGGADEDEYNPDVVARGLMCGNQVCNFGLSDGQTPLEKSIEEYENELRLLKEKKKAGSVHDIQTK